ncbi:MAG: isoprenylcysteine carboxylmethyltransferase family protein [Planctomycetes bacterium]|nr:isoprenylcysteine carboxylmethyltransferase family protein [Planctomycetota bacterium]
MPASKKLTWRKAFALLVVAAFLFLALLTRPHPGFFVAGATLVVLGEAIRIWGTGHLEKNRRLVTSGPYAHLKNPLYLGTLAIMVGFALAAAHPREPSLPVLAGMLAVGLVAYFGVYFPKKKRVEYERLRRRFGAQAEHYIAAVPDLVPRLRPFRPAPGEESRWRWRQVAENSEVETALFCLAGLLLVGSKFFWQL